MCERTICRDCGKFTWTGTVNTKGGGEEEEEEEEEGKKRKQQQNNNNNNFSSLLSEGTIVLIDGVIVSPTSSIVLAPPWSLTILPASFSIFPTR
jgi:hypothetical protein